VTAAAWVFRFMPRPGEKLSLKVTRPKGVEGHARSRSTGEPEADHRDGARSSDDGAAVRLIAARRAGGNVDQAARARARVTSVSFDGGPHSSFGPRRAMLAAGGGSRPR
jgi:hypothetical protein